MKSLLILTEAGSDIGYGHLTRCRSIAAAFRHRGYKADLIVQAENVELRDNEQCECWRELRSGWAEVIGRADIVMFDSLQAKEGLFTAIQHINPRTVVIDDYLHRDYNEGVVVDWTVDAEGNSFHQRSQAVRYLLGSSYCALRPPFWTPPTRAFETEPKRILVTLGGSDIRGLTCPLAGRLMNRFPGVELHAIIGGGVRYTEEHEALCIKGAHVHQNLDALAIRNLMDEADVAISGGGQTLYELACRGLPAVVVNLIDNQTEDIRGFSSRGFAVLACQWDAADLLDRVESGVREVWHRARRETASAIGRLLVDGQGAFRLVTEIEHVFYGGK